MIFIFFVKTSKSTISSCVTSISLNGHKLNLKGRFHGSAHVQLYHWLIQVYCGLYNNWKQGYNSHKKRKNTFENFTVCHENVVVEMGFLNLTSVSIFQLDVLKCVFRFLNNIFGFKKDTKVEAIYRQS